MSSVVNAKSKVGRVVPNAPWPTISLGEVGRWFGGGTPSKSNAAFWTEGTIPWVSPKDMKQPLIDDAQDHITEKAVRESSTNMVDAGSVLVVARSGILQHTLPVAITTRPVALNQDIKAVKPNEGVMPEFLAMALKAFEREILHTCTKTGTTVQSLEVPVFHRFQIPLPPVDKQRRIVAEIEKQFTRLDAGVAALRRTQANLKRYRAAVLKSACEGRLVPAIAPRTTRASDGWCHTELGKVVTFSQGLQVPVPEQRLEPQKHYVPFIRIVNYTQKDADFRYIVDPGEKYFVEKDDVVMVRYGTPGLVGRGFTGVIANNLFRIVPDPILSKHFLYYFLKSKAVVDLIRSRQRGGTMQAISFGQLQDIPIGIPPQAAQERIVDELERRLSLIEETETVVTNTLHRAAHLRKSILQKAFSRN